MIAVTFALSAESSGFLRRLHKKSKTNRNGITVICGEVDGGAIEVFHTGVGEKTCRERMAKFLQDRQFDCLISAGFAGALNDRLHVGDLLLAENFSTIELTEARSALSTLSVHAAALLTLPSMVESREERNKIAQTTAAAAADMETKFIARACAEHGTLLLSLRVISDNKPLPAPANVLFNIERQRTDLTRFTLHFLKHPGAIPRLIAFAQRIARARKTLANALVNIVCSMSCNGSRENS